MSEQSKAFPYDTAGALTMLYLQAQKLDGVTPEQLATLYNETHLRIKNQLAIEKKEARNITSSTEFSQ